MTRSAASDRRFRPSGSAQIIEMTVVLPVCLAVCAAVIILSVYAADGFLCEARAEKILSAAAREMTLPGSSVVDNGSGSISADIISAYRMFSQSRPYRYLTPVDADTLRKIADDVSRALSNGLCDAENMCTVTCERRVSGILLRAEIERKVNTGSVFGLSLPVESRIEVCAVSFDNPESVRNTRLLTDSLGALKDLIGAGGLPGLSADGKN